MNDIQRARRSRVYAFLRHRGNFLAFCTLAMGIPNVILDLWLVIDAGVTNFFILVALVPFVFGLSYLFGLTMWAYWKGVTGRDPAEGNSE